MPTMGDRPLAEQLEWLAGQRRPSAARDARVALLRKGAAAALRHAWHVVRAEYRRPAANVIDDLLAELSAGDGS